MGALVSPDAPGDVWAHITMIEAEGEIPKLHGGIPVEFEFVAARQDSFNWIAERVILLK